MKLIYNLKLLITHFREKISWEKFLKVERFKTFSCAILCFGKYIKYVDHLNFFYLKSNVFNYI